MEAKSNRKGAVRRTSADMQNILEEQARSGGSVRAFCAGRGISETVFYYWKRRLTLSVVPSSFSRVEILDPAGVLFAEVKGVKLFQPVSAAYLKELLS